MNYNQNLAPGLTLRHTKSEGSKNSGPYEDIALTTTEFIIPESPAMGVAAKASISFNLSEARDRDRIREIAKTLLNIVGEV
jgi:hypothetical protein